MPSHWHAEINAGYISFDPLAEDWDDGDETNSE